MVRSCMTRSWWVWSCGFLRSQGDEATRPLCPASYHGCWGTPRSRGWRKWRRRSFCVGRNSHKSVYVLSSSFIFFLFQVLFWHALNFCCGGASWESRVLVGVLSKSSEMSESQVFQCFLSCPIIPFSFTSFSTFSLCKLVGISIYVMEMGVSPQFKKNWLLNEFVVLKLMFLLINLLLWAEMLINL